MKDSIQTALASNVDIVCILRTSLSENPECVLILRNALRQPLFPVTWYFFLRTAGRALASFELTSALDYPTVTRTPQPTHTSPTSIIQLEVGHSSSQPCQSLCVLVRTGTGCDVDQAKNTTFRGRKKYLGSDVEKFTFLKFI